MLLAFGIVLCGITITLLVKYLNGELVQYQSKWLNDFVLVTILIVAMAIGIFVVVNEVVPKPHYIQEPPAHKELTNGKSPLCS